MKEKMKKTCFMSVVAGLALGALAAGPQQGPVAVKEM